MKTGTQKTAKDRSFGKRWEPKLEDAGFVQVSSFFLEHYHRLKPYPITYGEAMFVIHLMQFKWDAAKPYPAYKTLSSRMHVSDKTARRLATSLEQKGYLNREVRVAQTNRFDLTGLMNALVKLKAEMKLGKEGKEDGK